MKLNRQNTEIFSQQHQMYAEGAEDEQMTEKDVFDFLYALGWESTGTIEIFHDDMQGLWRWIANKIAYPKPKEEGKEMCQNKFHNIQIENDGSCHWCRSTEIAPITPPQQSEPRKPKHPVKEELISDEEWDKLCEPQEQQSAEEIEMENYEPEKINLLRQGFAEGYNARTNGLKIVCYCGSLRVALEAFKKAEYESIFKPEIALLPCCMFVDIQREYGEKSDYKVKADELHKRKIDICDEVFVLNVGSYIGASTRSEIEYAKSIGKPVKYLEPINPPNSI